MPDTRSAVFDRVTIDYLVRGSVRVAWRLRPAFRDPAPLTFQVQVRREGGLPWAACGAPVVDAFQAFDEYGQRLFGTDRRIEYRVVLTTSRGTYDSPSASPLGKLDRRAWLAAREMLRSLRLKSRGLPTLPGYLLKRKSSGTPCSDCLDVGTGLVLDSDCPTCSGTRFVAGYWRAIECVMTDLEPAKNNRTNAGEEATTNPGRDRVGQFVGPVVPEPKDIWVETGSDRRYVVGQVSDKGHFGSVPILVACALEELPHGDPAYAIEI